MIRHLLLASLDFTKRIWRFECRIHVTFQVAQSQHLIIVLLEVEHVLPESLGGSTNPRMLQVGDAVELKDDNFAFPTETQRFLEIVQGPIRPSIPGGGNEQRMILARFVSDAFALLIGVFRRTAAPGKFRSEE